MAWLQQASLGHGSLLRSMRTGQASAAAICSQQGLGHQPLVRGRPALVFSPAIVGLAIQVASGILAVLTATALGIALVPDLAVETLARPR